MVVQVWFGFCRRLRCFFSLHGQDLKVSSPQAYVPMYLGRKAQCRDRNTMLSRSAVFQLNRIPLSYIPGPRHRLKRYHWGVLQILSADETGVPATAPAQQNTGDKLLTPCLAICLECVCDFKSSACLIAAFKMTLVHFLILWKIKTGKLKIFGIFLIYYCSRYLGLRCWEVKRNSRIRIQLIKQERDQ